MQDAGGRPVDARKTDGLEEEREDLPTSGREQLPKKAELELRLSALGRDAPTSRTWNFRDVSEAKETMTRQVDEDCALVLFGLLHAYGSEVLVSPVARLGGVRIVGEGQTEVQ